LTFLLKEYERWKKKIIRDHEIEREEMQRGQNSGSELREGNGLGDKGDHTGLFQRASSQTQVSENLDEEVVAEDHGMPMQNLYQMTTQHTVS
jgi:hypothetical protein